MAQGGNVLEWEETDANLVNGPSRAMSAGFAAAIGAASRSQFAVDEPAYQRPDGSAEHPWLSRRNKHP